ncbi:MAG: flavin reductase family protein [Actinomycetota bacterium]|nr:flavin reductase family protein [Actinomycetota bacterium]
MFDDLEATGASAFDVAHFRQVMGRFCTGVTIITAVDSGEPVGFTAQSFTSVSLEPPLVSFCPGKTVASWSRIRSAGAFCVNILSERQEALCRTFASKGRDKFRGVGWHPGPATGSPVLDGVIGWVEARVVAEHDAGDHLIVVGRVVDLDTDGGQPLLFYRGGFGRFEP